MAPPSYQLSETHFFIIFSLRIINCFLLAFTLMSVGIMISFFTPTLARFLVKIDVSIQNLNLKNETRYNKIYIALCLLGNVSDLWSNTHLEIFWELHNIALMAILN